MFDRNCVSRELVNDLRIGMSGVDVGTVAEVRAGVYPSVRHVLESNRAYELSWVGWRVDWLRGEKIILINVGICVKKV